MENAYFAPGAEPKTLTGLIQRQALARPRALAVRFLPDAIGYDFTYAQLHSRSQRAAARLWHDLGVRPGDRVAWLGQNHPDMLALLLALARIGAALVPLNYRLAAAEWRTQLAQCTPNLLICDAVWEAAAQELGEAQGLGVDRCEHFFSEPVALDAPRHDQPGSPCLLVYTSGTTGQPRAAVHSQANLLANMRIASSAQALVATDTIASMLPLFHVGGLCIQTLPAFYAGACVVLLPRFEPGAALACFGRERPTLTLQVPATMQALISHPQWAVTELGSLRAVWAGSSILPAHLIEAFHARSLPVCNVYGATETGPFSIALPPASARSHVGSCGWPAPGVEVRLARTAETASQVDGVGEIWLRAPNVVEQYWPDASATDSEGWFRSGDLARCACDGSYTVVGRAKDMVISGGENIYPAEVENALLAHPAVAECAVLGLPDAQWGEVLAAAVVLREGASLDLEALREFLARGIARFKLPRSLHCVQALPKTALGKVRKDALRELLLNS